MCFKSLLIAFLFITAAHADDSFRADQLIFQEKSLYRNLLVTEGEGYRCMKFGRFRAAHQSCVAVDDPRKLVLSYTQGLLSGLYMTPAPHRILIIGLGGGIMPMAFRAIDAALQIDTVELDAAVVRVAKSHFGYQEDSLSRVYVGDGRVFVRKQLRAGVRYDLVVIDAFDKDYIPEHMLTREFLTEVKTVLTSGGSVAANTFARGPLEEYEAATYQDVFGTIYDLDMSSGNRIILASKDGPPPFNQLEANAQWLNDSFRKFGLSSDSIFAQLKAKDEVKNVRVLTDQFSPSNLLLQYKR